MNWLEQCAAVIPCCNEGATIRDLVREVRRFVPCVFVVDDGSLDNTAAEARLGGAEIVRLETNAGKGNALNAGLLAVRKRGFSWAVLLDGDGQHKAEDIPGLAACAQSTGAELVIGNRMHAPDSMPWLRRQVNRWLSYLLSKRAGRPLPDTQSGFRLLALSSWARVPLKTSRFEIESEMLMSFLDAGCGVEFVPVQVIGRAATSHIRPLQDTWRWLRWWHRLPARARSAHCCFSGCHPSDVSEQNPRPRGANSLKTPVSSCRPTASESIFTPDNTAMPPAAPIGLKQPNRASFWIRKIAVLLVVGLLLGWAYDWTAPRFYRKEVHAGFWSGTLHGALMPVALPTLLLGRDVPIFADNNNGRPYKIGYILGINLCGLLFFGISFRKPAPSS